MNYPPSLTWMHLLPRELPLVTVGAPDWLCASIAKHVGAAQPHGGAASVGVARADAGAVVVVNGSRGDAEALRHAGFAHVSRFAAMPNLRNARWFIPLDSRRAASAAFCVYTPSKRSAMLRRAAARVAARLGVRGWYGDEVLIARRAVSPLETLLHQTLNVPTLCLSLSAGAPEGAINRKCSVAAIEPDGTVLAFAKVASGPLAEGLVANEHRVLRAMTDANVASGSVPEALFGGECAGSFTLIQRPLLGRPAGADFTPAHAAFLQSLQIGPEKALTESRLIDDILRRARELGDRAAPLRPLLDDLAARGPNVRAPVTIVHGDFAPWNLLVSGGRLRAFDWEYGNEDGLPVLDETNHRLQVAHLIHHRSADEAVAMLDATSRVHQDLAPDTVALLQHICVLDTTTRLLTEGYDTENEMLAWYLAIAERIARRVAPEAVTS